MKDNFSQFNEIWCADFEFGAAAGEQPNVRCMVAKELKTGRTIKLWEDEARRFATAPFNTGDESLFIAYFASAELGCFLSLGWPLPTNVLDLCIEFKNLTNGKDVPAGKSLLGAMVYYGMAGIDAADKEAMRELALRGDPYTEQEKSSLIEYCESDVVALEKLFIAMKQHIDLPRALLRGRYMQAVANIEFTGISIDTDTLGLLKAHWTSIQDDLIAELDKGFGFFDGRTFKSQRFAEYLICNNLSWPLLPTGSLDLSDETFKEMCGKYPHLNPIREVRNALSKLRLSELSVGSDGRNRCLLSPFQSKTGRNQPSNSRFIFGPSVWLRGLIKPTHGRAISYIDYSQQEFGIAAALSCDQKMMAAYVSGDPYLSFAKQAGAVPPEGTKESHSDVRDLFKACVLAVQYGMGEASLASRIGVPVYKAKELLELHRKTYPIFWAWSDAVVDYVSLYGEVYTVFGWKHYVTKDFNPRSIRNFPMQANGAEILRLACSMATEAGIKICAPIHDALLIEAPIDEIDLAVISTQKIMADASAIVLNGFSLRSDVKTIKYPDRYMDKRGTEMWNKVLGLIHSKASSGGAL